MLNLNTCEYSFHSPSPLKLCIKNYICGTANICAEFIQKKGFRTPIEKKKL